MGRRRKWQEEERRGSGITRQWLRLHSVLHEYEQVGRYLEHLQGDQTWLL